jgi:hypothetical protein
LDAPGNLHHVIGRGIEGTKIFRNEGDKRNFLSRVAQFCQAGFWMGYTAAEVARFLGVTAWAVVRATHSESHPEIDKYL